MPLKKRSQSKIQKSSKPMDRNASSSPSQTNKPIQPSSSTNQPLKGTEPVENTNKPVFNQAFDPNINSNNLDPKLRLPTFFILSIDGGGARGMIPAVILKEIEQRSGRRISELFDRICGTSTGSILACGISAPKSSGNSNPMFRAREIVEIYRVLGQEIFSRGSFNETVIQPIDNLLNGEISIGEILRPIASIQQAVDTVSSVWKKVNAPLHDVQKLAYLLHGYLGDLKMKDALTELFVYAYDIGSRTPQVLGSTESSIPKQAHNYSNFRMYQTATGSSAAVPFFAPYTVWKKPSAPWMVDVPMRSEDVYPDPGGNGDSFDLVDGGNGGLGNPALFATLEDTQASTGKHKIVLSLGTGHFTESISSQAKSWGFLQWLGEGGELLKSMFDGEADVTDMALSQMLVEDVSYFRWQPKIPESLAFLDEGSTEDMNALENVAREYISDIDEEIDKLVEILTSQEVRIP